MANWGRESGGAADIGEETEDERILRLAHERRRIAAAIKSVAGGRVLPLTELQAWANSLGSDHVLPLPRARRWADRAVVAGEASLADEAAEALGHIEWFYARPGDGPTGLAIRRVRAIVAAIDRLATQPESGLPGNIPGTRELMCQNHRIVYVVVRRNPAATQAGDAVVFDIFGPGQP